MFWGLIMEPQKKYTQVVKKPFHISMAALDMSTGTSDSVQVMCGYDNRKYLLCTLDKEKAFQCPLDLNFDVGVEVSFITNGTSNVHLSGYLVQEEEDLFDDLGEEEEEEDEDAEVSLGNISASNIVGGKRSKDKAEGQLNGLSGKLSKKLEALSKSAPPAKKLKTMELLQNVQDDDEDSEDDVDVELSDLLGESDDDDDTQLDDDMDDEEDDDEGEEEEDDDEEDEDDDDEDDDDEEDEDGEDEEDEVFDIPPQNGTAKKAKKEQQPAADKKKAKKEEAKSPHKQGKSPKKTVEGGVQVEDIRPGSGAVAKAGKTVRVYYEGRFQKGNKMFDSSTRGKGFGFRLGQGEVIKGWDVGVEGMKVGGKRRIVCPPAMAYGARGSPPTIPPNSTLVFEVELKSVN